MKRLLIVLLALASLPAPAGAPRGQTSGLFAEIQAISAELTRITGLGFVKKVEYAPISKQGVNQFLRERLKEEMPPEEIRAEELVLKKFGFVPPDYDLAQNTIELFTEQAAAFYDFRKKKLFVLESAPPDLQRMALVHELAHALADQHFHLEKFIRRGGASDDNSLARMAVMEGQAAYLMSEYAARQAGQSLRGSSALAETVRSAAELSAGRFPVFDAAPLYVRETLLFPYTYGMLFQHAVVEKLGQEGFREVFRRPPSTAQQILHPEMYFSKVEPIVLTPPKPPRIKDYKLLAAGVLGELDHQILLRQCGMETEAEGIARRWRGAAYELYENQNGAILTYVSAWDGGEAARRFFASYRRVLKGKWQAMEAISETPDCLLGRGDGGYFTLRLQGSAVTAVEGLPSAEQARSIR